MKSIKEIKAAQHAIVAAAIQTAAESRASAEAISTKMEAVSVKVKLLNDKYKDMWQEREALLRQAEECDKVVSNA